MCEVGKEAMNSREWPQLEHLSLQLRFQELWMHQ